MDVSTLYVGQGALAVVRHSGEALIVDSHLPDEHADVIEAQLRRLLRHHSVPGLILTGFDADHCSPAGIELILSKFEPTWVMYPKYYKDTDSAGKAFSIIEKFERKRKSTSRPLRRHSMRLDRLESRLLSDLSTQFSYELFSPHTEDMDSSNNSSIVMKVKGLRAAGFSYLITGDTEKPRWERINEFFDRNLRADVMAAPHHGATSGCHPKTGLLVIPNTVLISAGIDSQYGHPNSQAVSYYRQIAKHVFATNVEQGVSLFTRRSVDDFETSLFR
jgi:beta-lactamase superfamily II metal-dependent hydrolase